MHSVGKLGTGQENYYLEKVAEGAEDYYSGEGEAEGQWIGEAAAELGLSGDVAPEQLTAMLTGHNPADGEPLGLRAVGDRGPVPGFDLTFSAPKSVSLLWALGGPEVAAEVSQAHARSVEAALTYMQREACWTRRGAGGSQFVKGNGYLAAAYVHRSSRNGDPQLHTHVLVANATKGPDGRWTRLYHPAIYDHAKTAGYLYEAQLRHELTRSLGVDWQEVRNGIAEIEGFADEHLRTFSTRRAEILEAAGPDASARARQVANLTTRSAKEKDISRKTLRERWHSKAREIGLGREAIEGTLGVGWGLDSALAIHQLDREVTAHASHFDRRDAVQAVANLLPKGAPAEEVERTADAFLASDAVVRVSESAKGERFTTKRIWELEREALATAQRMRGEPRGQAGELLAARAIQARPTLKADQREMVRRLLADREGLVVVVGEAGTGKTFAIVAAAEGWAQAGYELRAAAPTWRAANVLRSEGLEATSIASLLAELDRNASGALSSRSVLLVDEAGMVGSEDLARLISHADDAGAKLVPVGDPEQLGEIEAGGLFGALAQRSEPIYLDEVIRHNHALDRDAAKHIREGQGREALTLYRSAERVTVAPDAEARREAIVADWWRSFGEGQDALMVAKRNAEVERLNATARELMRSEGKLGSEEIEVGEARFAAGDQVITRVNDRANEIYNRERWRVAEVDAGKHSVVLEGIDQASRVEIGPEYLARTNPYGDAPALQHAYAVTTYCAQGTTVDRAFVVADASMDKQELYVAASRSREETYLYVTPEIQAEREEYAPKPPDLREDIGHIAEAAERDRAQKAAHDVAHLEALPTTELARRRDDLRGAARAEASNQREREALRDRIESKAEFLAGLDAQRESVRELPRRMRRNELERIDRTEATTRQILARHEAEARRLPAPEDRARQELAAVDRVLAQRRQVALAATRIAPPAYVVKELGERPSGPRQRKAWERGVEAVEGYRQEHGIKDSRNALGPNPKAARERAARDAARRRLREAQRDLGMGRDLGRSKKRGMGLGIGR